MLRMPDSTMMTAVESKSVKPAMACARKQVYLLTVLYNAAYQCIVRLASPYTQQAVSEIRGGT